MLQCGQDSTLNHAEHRFDAHSIRNYGHIASISIFHPTSVSQCDHHASILNNSQNVLLDQLWGSKTMAYISIHQSYNTKRVK